MDNNLIKYYKYYLFCKSALWIGPIITLFYLANDLSFTQIFIIASYYKIAVAFFEVPTGAFADKFGHKKSVLLGLLITSIGICFYPLGSNFIYYLIIETLLAIGATLISGADEALFYDTLKINDKEKEYATLKGKASQYSFLSQLIGSLVAAALYVINPAFPFLISGVIVFAGFLLFLTFKEIEIKNKNSEKVSYFMQIKSAGIYIFKHKKIRTIIIYASLINMTYISLIHTYAPYLLSVNISENYFGILFALFNIVAIISSRNANKFIKKTKSYSLISLGIILLISFLLIGFITIPIGILGIFIQQVYRGMSSTIFNKYVNKAAPSEKRATILSYLSLSMTLIGGTFGILIGFILDNLGINNTYLILAFVTGITIIIMDKYLKKNLN